jgi:starch-binding outer membrane protein, SusD/RagB family
MTRILGRGLPALVAAGVALGSAACTDLTETPYTEITEANFNPTASDLAALMAPAYTPLRNVWMGWYGNLDFQEETADAFVTPVRPNGWYDGGTYIRLHEHRWDAGQGQPATLWGNSFSGINAANRVIYQIESGVIPVDAEVQTPLLAELKALRAYYYYLLLDGFANVPIVTDFTSVEVPAQSSRQEVYEFVVSELTAAIPELSEETGVPTYGRMNRWAALGILARVYLNAEVYVGAAEYDEVIRLTQEIIDSGNFALEADYRAPFARENHNSTELVWAVPYDAINAGGSSFHMKTLKPELRFVFNMQAQPWGGSASNPQFIETYDESDTRLGDTWLMGPQFDAQGRGYNFVQHVPSITDTEFHHGFPVRKYEIYAGMTGSSDVDYPIMRYAEVLMMHAEAQLRSGNPDAAATLVTQVRQRAFAETDPSRAVVTGAELQQGSTYNYGWYDEDGVVKTGPGGAPVTNGGADVVFGRFLDELGWEFAAEGHRRQHLIRFGVFDAKTWFNHAPNGTHRKIFAIPNDALETNPNLSQNPGY